MNTSTKWTERYNFLRFWASIVGAVLVAPIVAIVLFVFIVAPILQAVLS